MKIILYNHSKYNITSKRTLNVNKFGEYNYFSHLDEEVLRGVITYTRQNYYYKGTLIACLVNVYNLVKLID